MWKITLSLCLIFASGVFSSVQADTSGIENSNTGPITEEVWQEVVVSVTDLDRTANFFKSIGGYEEKWRGALHESEVQAWGLPSDASGQALLLGQANREEGYVRLIRFDNAGDQVPTRPGARSWDTGCYFSIMVRMKAMESVYTDAITITQHTFGDSELNIVVFKGPDGVQVQAYERLSLAIPEAFPKFERFSGPFNLMQMVSDRDASYEFFTKVLGFATFYNGKPYVSKEPESMPLGIPINLTTSVRYRAGIVYPVVGELGRMEMIEIMDLEGHDFADRCKAPNLGILAVRYPVKDAQRAVSRLALHQWPLSTPVQDVTVSPYGDLKLFSVKTPDGANVQFFQSSTDPN